MCGIAGFFNLSIDIERVFKNLNHRGRDGNGIYQDEMFLGFHTRLSIVDIDGGPQPWVGENGDVLIFNGEIYNYRELKKELEDEGVHFISNSDTEVLFWALRIFGERVWDKLNGMWAFCLYSPSKRTLRLSRDRLGEKPLYIYRMGDSIAFASELSVLVEELNLEKDEEFILPLFDLGVLPEPYTPYKNLEVFKAGSHVEFRNNKQKSTVFWTHKFDLERHQKLNYEYLRHLIRDSVRLRAHADVPYTALISGGIDSTILASILGSLDGTSREVITFNIENEPSELLNARSTAKRYGLKHKIARLKDEQYLDIDDILKTYGMPFNDTAVIGLNTLFKNIKSSGYSMALTGDGGDEVSLGYPSFTFEYFLRDYSRIMSLFGSKFKRDDLIEYYIRNKHGSLFESKRKELASTYQSRLGGYQMLSDILSDSNNSVELLSKLNFEFDLKSQFLVKNDRLSMRNGIELRLPFLDHRIIEYLRTVTYEDFFSITKRNKALLKNVYKNELSHLKDSKIKRGFVVPFDPLKYSAKDQKNMQDEWFMNQITQWTLS